jgi:hypothetical protein
MVVAGGAAAMNAYVTYADIPRAERKQLAAEAYRQTASLRRILFGLLFGAVVCAGPLFNLVLPKLGFLPDFGVRVAGSVMLYAIAWEVFGRRRLEAAVEKLKNFP